MLCVCGKVISKLMVSSSPRKSSVGPKTWIMAGCGSVNRLKTIIISTLVIYGLICDRVAPLQGCVSVSEEAGRMLVKRRGGFVSRTMGAPG